MIVHLRRKGPAIGIICLTLFLFVLSGCGGNAPPAKATAEKAATVVEKQADGKAGEADKKKARDEKIVKALEKASKDME